MNSGQSVATDHANPHPAALAIACAFLAAILVVMAHITVTRWNGGPTATTITIIEPSCDPLKGERGFWWPAFWQTGEKYVAPPPPTC